MVFSSLTFMFVFLPIVLLLYYIVPKKLKNLFILISGIVFYAWGEPIYVVVMLISTMIDYFAGLIMNRFEGKKIPRRICLIVSIVMNLGLLGVFKYSGFIAENINALAGQNLINIKDLHFFGIDWLPMNMLPIGISFFTFQSMSYTIDLYLGKVKVQKNPISCAA
ncbi:MAG: MBOAT family protein, partial [[Eubacterium] siraeum]|nr:MBOAT family protein [[Eubacterium] siraeum]